MDGKCRVVRKIFDGMGLMMNWGKIWGGVVKFG